MNHFFIHNLLWPKNLSTAFRNAAVKSNHVHHNRFDERPIALSVDRPNNSTPMVKGFHANIEQLTLDNDQYRQVLYTAKHAQLVLMTLKPKEEIGFEVHRSNDQFFRFEQGRGKVIINHTKYLVKNGDAIIVPAGAKHNVINTSATKKLKLYTLYSPPHHEDGMIRGTKAEAEANDPEFAGVTTE